MLLRSLFLLPLCLLGVVAADVEVQPASSFWVPSLPDIYQNTSHPLHLYAGHVPTLTDKDKLYFVMVKNRKIADKDRVIFWFNGGPGCSSFDGIMMEVGPWRTNFHGGFNITEGGWEEYTNMVYVDQPVGTGFSMTSNGMVKSMGDATKHLLEFFRNFYRIFPEFVHMDTYLAGESFAGQYIPYFADGILNSNLPTKLRGVAIGNAWIDGRSQYPAYLDFAVKAGLLQEGSKEWKESKQTAEECKQVWDAMKPGDIVPINVEDCAHLINQVSQSHEKVVNGEQMCINVFDIRYDDTAPACGMNWPPDIHHITTYLDRPEVVKALHAESHPKIWKECRPEIRETIDENPSNSSITLLPRLIERIPVLIFAGDQDLICNHVGLEAMIDNMSWNGAKGLGKAEAQDWTVGGKPAGTWVESRNLTYAKVYNASHMAPYDAPEACHDMMLRFMGVDFSAIVDGSAKIPSSIGAVSKPLFAATPSGTPSIWQAYYTTLSAALGLILVVGLITLFFWWRAKRRQKQRGLGLPPPNDEESIPLASHSEMEYSFNLNGDDRPSRGKGKQHQTGPILTSAREMSLSDDEDDDGAKSGRSTRGRRIA